MKTTSSKSKAAASGRPEKHVAQQEASALSWADFSDAQLFAELRRRGYTGELRYVEVIKV